MRCGTCGSVQSRSAEFCAACGSQLRIGRPLARAGQMRGGTTGAVGDVATAVEYWPNALPSPGLRLRPEPPVRLTWRHVTRWVLGLLLTVVLLGFVFAALRMGQAQCIPLAKRSCETRTWWPPYAPVSVPQPAPTPLQLIPHPNGDLRAE